jgi:hypothetical protein
MWLSNFRHARGRKIGQISALAIAALIFANVIWGSTAHAQSKRRLSAYLGFEQDFCPNGFAERDCPLLTAEKFDELRRYGRLRLLKRYDDIPQTDRQVLLPAAQEMIAYARRIHFSDENPGEHRPAILMVAERGNAPDNDNRDVTGTIGRDDRPMGRSQISKPLLQRSFDFGSLRDLDPEAKHEWTFFRGADRFTIMFVLR